MNRPAVVTGPGERRRQLGLAFAWGLAESTVFFIVPDVFITRLALRDYRRALAACVAATAGALLGGTILWIAARNGAARHLLDFFTLLPGINSRLIAQTGQALYEHGLPAFFTGAVSGRPYKLYAVHAGTQGIPLAMFLLVSLAARLARFAATATGAWLAGRALRARTETFRLRLHLAAWTVFYLIYFAIMR